MTNRLSVQDLVEAIEKLDAQERHELLSVLPAVLKVSSEDYGWLSIAQSSFDFWDNEADAVYDTV